MNGHSVTRRMARRMRRLAIRGSEWAGARVATFPEHQELLAEEIGPAYETIKPFTMTSTERQYALRQGIKYIVEAAIPGDIVECGVWRGGSAMLCALSLLEMGESSRNIVLYDTFAGMPAPTEKDRDFRGRAALPRWRSGVKGAGSDWCNASLDDVRANLLQTGYPAEQLRFVQGKVEDTIPAFLPEQIALLRLDTDWYESTYHEMAHLFPRLAVGGVLVLDDYGHWQGAREAVDKYLAEQGIHMLLSRIDYTGRLAIKTDS